MITQADWGVFKAQQRQHFDAIAGTTVIWRKLVSNIDRYGEGTGKQFEDIPLQAIVAYNYFRSWPINTISPAGVGDMENFYILFNMDLLSELGYLSPNNNFDFDPVHDVFILNGITYYPQGDTPVGQIFSEAGLYMVILSREPINTGDPSR